MSSSAGLLSIVARRLKELGLAPAQVEHAAIGEFSFVNAFNEINSPIISDSITTGFDRDLTTAALKALVEWTERRAFEFGHRDGQNICQTERSDGFAAYPIAASNGRILARQNALAEAIERYVWASWWDDATIKHRHLDFSEFTDLERDLLEIASELEPISNAVCIVPEIANDPDHEVVIFFAELVAGGVISGGACGLKTDHSSVVTRALSELIRHAHAASTIRSGKTPVTFYEKRLSYFLTTEGENIARARIEKIGENALILPSLKFDSEVVHPASDVVCVHRCLFENQPPFIGGAVERFCL